MMKLNIGSGAKAVPDFTNLDYSPNVILSRYPLLKKTLRILGVITDEHMTPWDPDIQYRDARKLDYPKNTVELIYSSHFLEHIYYWEAQNVLNRCYEALEPNGTLRLALPDYRKIAQKFVEDYESNPLEASWEFNKSLLSHPFHKSEKTAFFLNTRFGHIHKWHPTPALVEEMLLNAGFKRVENQNFQEGYFPELKRIEDRPEGTFYIEARK